MMRVYIPHTWNKLMTTARCIEHRITRNLMDKRELEPARPHEQLAERLITVLAVTAGMLLLGSYAQELLWALLAGAAVLTIGTSTDASRN